VLDDVASMSDVWAALPEAAMRIRRAWRAAWARHAAPAAPRAAIVYGRMLNLKAKFESGSS